MHQGPGRMCYLRNYLNRKNCAGFIISKHHRNQSCFCRYIFFNKIQCARIYSSLLYNDTVFYYFDGFDSAGIRNIGMGFRPMNQPKITILPNAILTLDKQYKNENGAFFARVIRLKNKFILCYDAIGTLKRETVSFASSTNLFQWSQSTLPNIDDHFGWRNGIYTSEPSYFTCHKNYLFVHSGGYKKFNTEYTTEELPANFSISHKDQSQKGKYVSGNVADAEQGLFYADANNPIFHAYRHNPIFINDYSNTEQDDHLGGNFYFFRTKKSDVILYQAKSKTLKRYSIFYTCKKRT